MYPGDFTLLELLSVDDTAGTLHFARRRMLFFDTARQSQRARIPALLRARTYWRSSAVASCRPVRCQTVEREHVWSQVLRTARGDHHDDSDAI